MTTVRGRAGDAAIVLVAGGTGLAVAALAGSGPVALGVGAVVGVLLGALGVRARVRPLVAILVLVGGAAGALIGHSVARILCLPGSCPGIEIAAAALTGLGALIGTAVVVGLATRSLDEYRRAVTQNRPPRAGP